MSVALESQAHSFPGLLRRQWVEFSRTVFGDLVATAIAISLMTVLFLACSFAVIFLARMAAGVFHSLGG